MNQRRILLAVIAVLSVTLMVCLGCCISLFLPLQPPATTLPQISTTVPPLPTTQSTGPTSVTTVPTLPTTEPPTEPTEPPTEPTEPPTEPTEPPTEPTEPPTEPPTKPPTEPTVPPTDPIEPPPKLPSNLSVSAPHAFIFDVQANQYLGAVGDLDQQIAPASITKLFTAYVGLLYLPADQVLTAGREVRLVDIHSSFAYVKEGDQLTVEQCVQGMIIPSGNDASYVLAVNAGRAIAKDATLSIADACDVFMDEVNRQAKLLGLNNTHFVTPDGNHAENHYTCLRDLLRIAQLSLSTPAIRQAAQILKMQAVFLNDRQEDWENSNLLLDPTSKYYCADAIGLKTGSTSVAGKCLLSAFERDGKVYIVCVMGCSSSAKRYADTLALYNAFVNP